MVAMPGQTGQTGGPEIEWQVGSSCTRAQRALPSHGVTPNLFGGRMAMRPPDHHERTCGIHQGGLDYWDSEGRRYVGHLLMLDHAQGPAVLLAHNTPGVDDFERGVARRLAALGYVVLCVDYVGTGELLSMDQVHSRFGAAIADTTLLRGAMTAGLEAPIAQLSVDASLPSIIAWAAPQPSNLRAVGPMSRPWRSSTRRFRSRPESNRSIRSKILVQTGAADTMTPAEVRTLFESQMNEAGVDWRMILTAVFCTHSPSRKR